MQYFPFILPNAGSRKVVPKLVSRDPPSWEALAFTPLRSRKGKKVATTPPGSRCFPEGRVLPPPYLQVVPVSNCKTGSDFHLIFEANRRLGGPCRDFLELPVPPEWQQVRGKNLLSWQEHNLGDCLAASATPLQKPKWFLPPTLRTTSLEMTIVVKWQLPSLGAWSPEALLVW